MKTQDYVLLAAALQNAQPGFVKLSEGGVMTERKCGWCAAVEAVADACAGDNPAFDRTRFLKASGFDVIST